MFHRKPLKSLLAVVAALTAATAVTGTGLAGGVSQATASVVPSIPSDYTLYTEPAAGVGFIYNQINAAQSSIDMTMAQLSDTTAEDDLAAAAARGVDVRVILDGNEQSADQAAYNYLSANGVNVVWSWDQYNNTDEKSIVFDGTTADIMTLNLTSDFYATSRDFAVVDNNASDVSAIENVFSADFTQQSVTPTAGADLIWSPTSSQGDLADMINNATTSLQIYSQQMNDPTITADLVAAAERGVDVQVVGENQNGEYDSEYTTLYNAGVHISYYDSSDGLFIHGKLVLADYDTSADELFVGSQNFSTTSLTENRELGLTISDPAIEASVEVTFTLDYAGGIPWT